MAFGPKKRTQQKISAAGHPLWSYRFTGRKYTLLYVPNPPYPVAAIHLACIEIQRIARGMIARRRAEEMRVMNALGEEKTWDEWLGDNVGTSSKKQSGLSKALSPRTREIQDEQRRLDLLSKFMQITANTNRSSGLPFKDWCASRIQAWWRMIMAKQRFRYMRFMVYTVAATDIQRLWRWHVRRRLYFQAQKEKTENATRIIQRSWRRYCNRQIYAYYRDLIAFRNRGDPRTMLRCINPLEAQLIDAAAGIHVRFRLGGKTFPPTIYYKIFVHNPLVDVNAFAPRDYTKKQNGKAAMKVQNWNAKTLISNGFGDLPPEEVNGWYDRSENNDWRPVSTKIIQEMDTAPQRSVAKKYTFHYSSVKRKEDREMMKKKKKIEWMKKVYNHSQSSSSKDNFFQDDPLYTNEEGEEAELLKWSENLDFEKYFDNWVSLATTAPSDMQYKYETDFDPFQLDGIDEETSNGLRSGGFLGTASSGEWWRSNLTTAEHPQVPQTTGQDGQNTSASELMNPAPVQSVSSLPPSTSARAGDSRSNPDALPPLPGQRASRSGSSSSSRSGQGGFPSPTTQGASQQVVSLPPIAGSQKRGSASPMHSARGGL